MPITLSSRSVRRTALAGAAATLSIALAACSASFNAPTLQPYQAAEGTNADTGSIKVRNLLVLADAEGKGELHGVVVNTGDNPETLVKFDQAPAGTQDGQAGSDQPTPGSVTFSELKEPVKLEPHTSVLLPGAGASTGSETPSASDTPSSSETPGAEGDGPAVSVTGAKPGQMVNVTITFGQAAPITTYIPVLTDDHYSPSPNASE
ncbi:hypothetical protein AB0E69_16495 [Kribbella sp. NPDC026611]|uniref:hypothetical protein n=1 Tax=Kribbella sp. NPDC026611 TaxID=3154911 RepID=UPI0033E96882